MDLFRPIDFGTTYFFNFLTETNVHLLPAFRAGCFLAGPWIAGLVALLTALLLARQGHHRAAMMLLAYFLAGSLLVEAVRFLVQRPPSTFALIWLEVDGPFRANLRALSSIFPSESIFLSTFAWIGLWITARKLDWNQFARLAILLLAFVVVFGGFVCNLFLARHYLSDLLAGLAGGAGLALLAWSFDRPRPEVAS